MDPVHFEKNTIFSGSSHLKYDWENIIFDNYSKDSIAIIELTFFKKQNGLVSQI